MKVLHVIPGLSVQQGGMQTALLNLCRAQRMVGMQPEIAALHEPHPPDEAYAEFQTHLFECAFRPTGASRAMKRWLADNARAYDAVVAHSLWRNPLLYAAASAGDRPFVIMAHGMLDPEAMQHRALRKLWRLKTRLPGVLRRATVVYTCEAERQRATQGVAALAPSSAVIALPVEVPEQAPPPAPDGPIVALGRIHPRKGLLEWVNALALLHERGVRFKALHAGPVEDERYAARVYAAAAPLTQAGVASFEGAVPYRRAQELLAGARIVAAPCAVHENFGMVIAEAMALQRPVVAGRKGLIVSELAQAGAVIPTDATPQALADGMQQLLDAPEKADALAQAGRQWAAKNYTPQAVGKQWRKLL
jgi:glycosyltransferase involved in cell wall biosynthesis